VLELIRGEGQIAGGALPGGSAVTTWHIGPHDTLGGAHARIEAWLNEHSREPAGASWKVYDWIDLGQDTDPKPHHRISPGKPKRALRSGRRH
jgi:hypothetical protein